MKSIFSPSDFSEINSRIENLKPDSKRHWGKMDPAQMLAHCSEAMKMTLGDIPQKRTFMGYLIGGLLKKSYLSEKPFSKNSPTSPLIIISDSREFEKEKQILIALTKRLHEVGEQGTTKDPHGFFGYLTPTQWGQTQWKHLDHHLQQFGV